MLHLWRIKDLPATLNHTAPHGQLEVGYQYKTDINTQT